MTQVFRGMRYHHLLLERRIKQPGVPRWRADGFEFRSEDGAKLSVTLTLE